MFYDNNIYYVTSIFFDIIFSHVKPQQLYELRVKIVIHRKTNNIMLFVLDY